VKKWFYAALAVLYLLHNDLWLWNDGRIVAGLPVGLLYHLVYCLAAAALLAAVVRWAWPGEDPLGDGEDEEAAAAALRAEMEAREEVA
jgi:uncharacterized oligopeptide transporter (OPT) family protein